MIIIINFGWQMQIRKGNQVKILGFKKDISKAFRQKITALGIRKNSIFTVLHIAPFNGPIQINLGSLNLGFRVSELMAFELEILE